MPLQNRVDPFGEILELPLRGLFTGNRGIIHDSSSRTLTSRRWTSKSWLICSCSYKGVRRKVMQTRSWTELFFLDEATALAAGHRPCFLCRREAARSFADTWAVGHGCVTPSAREMDAVLHRQRLQSGRKRLNMLLSALECLPDGAMIAAEGAAYLVKGGEAYHWSPEGYRRARRLPFVDGLLTPPSTLKALRAGYRPVLHQSINLLEEDAA